MRFSSPVNFWRRFGLFRNSSGNRTRDLLVASLTPLSFYSNTQYNVINHSELCLTFTRGQRNSTKAASSPQSQSQGVFLRYRPSLCCGDSHRRAYTTRDRRISTRDQIVAKKLCATVKIRSWAGNKTRSPAVTEGPCEHAVS